MTTPVTPVGDNAFSPGMVSETYIPDQLIAGDLKLVTQTATITGAAAYVRGTIMGMQTASGKYVPYVAGASDGSQNPSAILVDNVDVTTGDKTCGLYLMGEFNGHCTTPNVASGLLTAAVINALRTLSIFIKATPVPATDPT